MTKNIRIENADTSSYKVVVEIWENFEDQEPVLLETRQLNNPTDMTTLAIWKNRYLVVREQ